MKIPNFLRVSLRDLFWLILVVGMGLGWYLEYRFAAPMRYAAQRVTEDSHLFGRVNAEYRGIVFEVVAMTKETAKDYRKRLERAQ